MWFVLGAFLASLAPMAMAQEKDFEKEAFEKELAQMCNITAVTWKKRRENLLASLSKKTDQKSAFGMKIFKQLEKILPGAKHKAKRDAIMSIRNEGFAKQKEFRKAKKLYEYMEAQPKENEIKQKLIQSKIDKLIKSAHGQMKTALLSLIDSSQREYLAENNAVHEGARFAYFQMYLGMEKRKTTGARGTTDEILSYSRRTTPFGVSVLDNDVRVQVADGKNGMLYFREVINKDGSRVARIMYQKADEARPITLEIKPDGSDEFEKQRVELAEIESNIQKICKNRTAGAAWYSLTDENQKKLTEVTKEIVAAKNKKSSTHKKQSKQAK